MNDLCIEILIAFSYLSFLGSCAVFYFMLNKFGIVFQFVVKQSCANISTGETITKLWKAIDVINQSLNPNKPMDHNDKPIVK